MLNLVLLIYFTISLAAAGVDSVNKDTKRGTLSTFSICGRISSIPLGSLALKITNNHKFLK